MYTIIIDKDTITVDGDILAAMTTARARVRVAKRTATVWAGDKKLATVFSPNDGDS